MSYRLAGLAAALLLAFSTHAQTPAAAPVPATTVLKAAHLFDGRSGALVSPGLVVVRGSRILAVGANVAIPAGANVIELGDATLVPGYIDAHTHIAYDHADDWAQGFYEGMLRFPVEQSFHAGRHAKVTLLAGVTSASEVGAGDFVAVALRNAIHPGTTASPRLLAAGHPRASTGGPRHNAPLPPD